MGDQILGNHTYYLLDSSLRDSSDFVTDNETAFELKKLTSIEIKFAFLDLISAEKSLQLGLHAPAFINEKSVLRFKSSHQFGKFH